MSYASIDDLRSQLGGGARPLQDAAYVAKMCHPLPTMPTVDRAAFIVKRCAGKRVLEFGASGALHEQIMTVATRYLGVDRHDAERVVGFDLDDVAQASLPSQRDVECPPWDLIVCGEVLEHLSNPGWFLTRLKRQCAGVPVLITVPNAFSDIARRQLSRGLENVNRDHVAWYSPQTLKTLVERAGWAILDWACYNGTAPTAEGLIVVVE